MNKKIYVVGAGITGATVARILAENNFHVELFDKRDVVSGNMYDPVLESGHRIHRYGPHAFHTNSDRVFNFLSMFTEWRKYEHKVVAKFNDTIVPVPFNFNSISLCFPESFEEIINNLSFKYNDNEHISILKLLKSKDPIEIKVAEYVYEHIFKYYTKKQWDMYPDEISPSVTARVPVRMGYDDRYFLDKYQAIPANGYTPMIENMLDHKNINIILNTEINISNINKDDLIVFTGSVDMLLNFRFGILPYRSLSFEFEEHPGDHYLPVAQMNFTSSKNYTRITDYSIINNQNIGTTIISKEYPTSYIPELNEPFYPIPNDGPRKQYEKYVNYLKEEYPNIILAGRLGKYRYYNMDQACKNGILTADEVILSLSKK